MTAEAAAVATIAYRDLVKFLRDPSRMASTFILPLLFIGALGGSMQASFGRGVGYDFQAFIFTGVFAQTLFQSAAFGIISLIEDRENDFSQEIFVSPISRYSIILGKIIGESLVALPQAVAVLVFAAVVGIPLSPGTLLAFVPVGIALCLVGGSFGLVILSNLNSQRAANQVFPFIMLPQYFLAGVFSPVQALPPVLDVLSRISPLRYAIDLTRDVYYTGSADYERVVTTGFGVNAAIMVAMFAVFLVVGTFLFVRQEQNR